MRRFSKYHGLGNDFVLFDAFEEGGLVTPEEARRICDRHLGIGADGIITLLPSPTLGAHVRMHLYNADGSEAEMCGNGLRCAVAHATSAPWGERLGNGPVRVFTGAGVREGSILPDGRVRVSLGAPEVAAAPMRLCVAGEEVDGLRVSMGNPHFVLMPYAESADLLEEARRLGPAIERDAAFPRRTNVELAKKVGPIVELVVHERGVGLTKACGTGAGATIAAFHELGLVDRRARVRLPGGVLDVELEGDGMRREAFIAGEAVRVFDGVLR